MTSRKGFTSSDLGLKPQAGIPNPTKYHASTSRSTDPANGLVTLTKRNSGSKAEVGFRSGRSDNLRGRRMNWRGCRRIGNTNFGKRFVNDILTIFHEQSITVYQEGKPTPDQRSYSSSNATYFPHLPKAHLHTPRHSQLMPPFMHPLLPPTPNTLLTSSRSYSDPHLASDSRMSCLFCIERVPVRSTFSAIVLSSRHWSPVCV